MNETALIIVAYFIGYLAGALTVALIVFYEKRRKKNSDE